MKFTLIAFAILACAGCTSTAAPVTERVDLRQKTEVECVASNFEDSGCRTEHEIWIVAPFGQAKADMPSVDDLRAPDAGSEF